jgi:quercetin dioxygenase-like cupin family protein
MLTASTTDLELVQSWIESDPLGRVRVNFPINKTAGSADSAVVYFEVQPGDYLPTHTDSAEEILYIVAGTGEAHVGDERGVVSKGDLAVIPAMAPHGIRNVGDETLKVVGFFSEAAIHSAFEEPLYPIGERDLPEMAPIAPVAA